MNKTLLLIAGFAFIMPLAKASYLNKANVSLQNYTSIDVRPVEVKPLKYGESMKLVFEGKRRNGKVRKFSGLNYKFNVVVEGATIKQNKISVAEFPTDKNLRYVKVNIKGRFRKKLADSLIIPLDFKHGLDLDFSGSDGSDGKNGQGYFGKPLMGRDGNSGEKGKPGGHGENGKDLAIKIWSEKDVFSDEEVYVLEVNNLTKKQKFYLRYMVNADSIRIFSNGGDGGDGGDGGRGGNGKDGSYDAEKDKYKEAGAGGSGGDGGDGGNGGNAGNIDLLVDDHSVEILQYIKVQNKAGKHGSFGSGHSHYGHAGRALEGQYQPSDGNPGDYGIPGQDGFDGYYHLRVGKI